VQAIIEVSNLTKRYKRGTTNAVDGISFNVAQGELFALLGPNGAGKTTTISILTTTLAPTSGRAVIAGYDVSTQARAVRRQVGIIFQNPSLDQNLTAEENVRFHAVLYGLYPFRPTFAAMPAPYREEVMSLANVLSLQDDIFKPIKRFSGGMKRKLEIIRSLIHKPKVLFLDEPTIGLDPASRRSLWEHLAQVRAERPTTILLTTHYLEEAEQADTICVINKGKIVAYGTPAQLKSQLTGDSYVYVDSDNRGQLRSELQSLGYSFEDQGPFRIRLNGHNVQQVMKALDTPLNYVQTQIPTLEDAYLAIVDGKDEERLIETDHE